MKKWIVISNDTFNDVIANLAESLDIPTSTGFCQAKWEWVFSHRAICYLSNEDIGELGKIEFGNLGDKTEINFSHQPGQAGEMYRQIIRTWEQYHPDSDEKSQLWFRVNEFKQL